MANEISPKSESVDTHDVEKDGSSSSVDVVPAIAIESPNNKFSIFYRLAQHGVETRGCQPVEAGKRTDTRFFNVFTVFSTSMLSLLPIGTGLVPTLFYGLSLRDSFLMIFFFSFLFTAPAAYIMTFAPRTGMRQMIQSRYSFGKYPNIIVCIYTMFTVAGFCVIASNIGGQCLSSVSDGKLSQEVGIILILLPAMCIAFAGYKVLHFYQRFAWIPVLFAILVAIGYGSNGLKKQVVVATPAAPAYINMISLMAGYLISFSNVCGDYCVYMPPNTPKLRLFSYCLFGICTPVILLLTLGSAIGGAIVNNPEWLAGYHANSTGGVLGAILAPAGHFGKFIMVILSFSVIGTCSREIYTVSVDFQVLIPRGDRIPRLIWVIITTGLVIGLAIGAAKSFYTALNSFLYITGYCAASYTAIIMLEFMWFRKSDAESYNHAIWDNGRKLPPGIAASISAVLPWALVVPSMDETWYTGPIAKITGDLGFEFAGLVTILLYVPLRTLEIKWRKGL